HHGHSAVWQRSEDECLRRQRPIPRHRQSVCVGWVALSHVERLQSDDDDRGARALGGGVDGVSGLSAEGDSTLIFARSSFCVATTWAASASAVPSSCLLART